MFIENLGDRFIAAVLNTASASMQEMGVLSLQDVMSFRVFYNALGLDLFSVISLE